MDISRNTHKLTIGIQSFEDIINGGYLYIDKTAFIYELFSRGKPYFLSRPRRFGKSLLLSTMKAYFEGRKELFEGLAITELTKDDPDAFAPHPVFYFDFNRGNYSFREAEDEVEYVTDDDSSGKREKLVLEKVLDMHLREWEKIYGCDPKNTTLALRFDYLLKTAKEKTGRQCVVLVDEYDKALLESDYEQDALNRSVFKGFFSVLKSDDAYLRFVFITGVTKFSKVSIFSDLNQLVDISLDERYQSICGMTESEIRTHLTPQIEALAERRGLTVDACFEKIRKMYDGYHFSDTGEGVYNPFSLLNCLDKKKFGSYWFETGTPTFLITKLRETDFDVKRITDEQVYANEKTLSDYRNDNPDPVPLLYQSGYLTIADYDEEYDSYLLDYPNDEVRYGFLECLAPIFLKAEESGNPLDIRSFCIDVKKGNTDGIRNRFTALFASLPYPSGTPDKIEQNLERDFQNVIYITFMLMGQYVKAEVHNATGRADAIVETSDFVYLFEFKRDKSAEEALKQIEDKGYDVPYAADSRKIFMIGVNFSSNTRNIDGWTVR